MTGHDPAFDPAELTRHAEWMRQLAWVLVRDESRADDLVQEAFVAALERRPGARESLRPWLAGVLRRRAAFERRSAGRRGAREAAHEGARPEPAAEGAARLERAEMHAELVQALTRLREPYRDVLLQRYYEGLTPKEIARRRGEPAATVRSRIKRGLEELRVELDRRFEGDRRGWALALVPLVGELRSIPSAPFPLPIRSSLMIASSLVVALVAFQVVSRVSDETETPIAATPTAQAPTSAPAAAPLERDIPARTAVPPALEPRATGGPPLTGRVIDAATGAPVPHYALDVSSGSDEPERLWSDADGSFASQRSYAAGTLRVDLLDHPALTGQAVAGTRVLMFARAMGLSVHWDPEQGPLELRAPVGPTLALRLSAERALAGLELRATLRRSAPGAPGEPRWSVRAPLRDDGQERWVRFAPLAGLLPEDGPWELSVETPDGLLGGELVVETAPTDGALELQLEPRARLDVALRSVRALRDPSVTVHGEGFQAELEATESVELPDGRLEYRFVLTSLHAGEYLVLSHAVGDLEPRAFVTTRAGTATAHVFELDPMPSTSHLRGELRSVTGDYREAVWLQLSNAAGETLAMTEARWEERDGAWVAPYAFEGLPAGELALDLSAMRAHHRWDGLGQPVTTPRDGWILTCRDDEPSGTLTLRVEDETTGTPIPGFVSEVALEGCATGQMLVRTAQVELRFEVPLDVRIAWSVSAPGYASIEGDESAFQIGADGLEAVVRLRPER